MPATGQTHDAQYAALSQRVTGIENSVNAISAQIGALATTINDRSKTPWGTLIAGLGVALVIGGGYTTLSRQPTDQAIVRLQDDVHTIEGSIVPRGEHERVWQNADSQFSNQQREIDEIKTALGGIWGVRDVIQELKENQKRLELALSRRVVE